MYKTNPRVRFSLSLTCGVQEEEWVVGWFSVLESSFRARREEVRTTFASNPVEVSIAAARQGRDAQPATEDTHSHTHMHTLFRTHTRTPAH